MPAITTNLSSIGTQQPIPFYNWLINAAGQRLSAAKLLSCTQAFDWCRPLDPYKTENAINAVWECNLYPLALDHLWEYISLMPKKGAQPLQGEVLQGTLNLLILQTLLLGPAHGHTIAYAIERRSDDVLQVEHGSLYPALHRLEDRGWIASFWGTSDNNRKARYYRLTPKGRKQLAEQTSRWEQLVNAVNRVLRPASE